MSIFVSFVSGAALFYLHRFFPYTAVILCLFLFLVFVRSRYIRHQTFRKSGVHAGFVAPVIIALLMLVLGFWRASAPYVAAPDLEQLSGQEVVVTGRLSAEPLPLQSDQTRFQNDMEIREASFRGCPLELTKMRLFTDSPMSLVREYYVHVKVPGDNVFLNPGALFGKETILSGYAVSVEEVRKADRNFLDRARDKLNAFYSAKFKGDDGAFLMSIITGERGTMSGELRNAFNVTGLAHILSISGAHFGLLLFILFKFFKLAVRLLPHSLLLRASLYISPSQIAALLCLPVITAYLGISTMEFPAVRSFIMITLFLFGLLIQRKGFWMNTLMFAAALIVLIQPESLLQLSFQLSFLAVLCLGFYSDIEKRIRERKAVQNRTGSSDDDEDSPGNKKAKSRLHAVIRKALAAVRQYVIASSLISLAATAGTAPLVAYTFNYFSLVSPLSNLVLTPFIGFVILPLSLASSFIYLFTDIFPLKGFIEASTAMSLSLIKYIATWSFAAVPVPSFPPVLLVTFYMCLLVFAIVTAQTNSRVPASLFARRKSPVILASMAIIPYILYAGLHLHNKQGLQVTFLDVGQGDGAVAELPDGRVMVVDTGKNGFQVANFLKFRGHRKIDLLVLTHGHPDHCGGLVLLLDKFQIGEIWDNDLIPYSSPLPGTVPRRAVARGDYFNGGAYAITVFHPYKGFYTSLPEGQEDNDYSVVMKIAGRKCSFLFTGDVSQEAEEDLAHLASSLKSTVLKVPHHGGRTSTAEAFLHYVSPDIAVISSGRKNIYGHPHPDTLAVYSNSRVYRTDLDGAISIEEIADGTLDIKTWRQAMITETQSAEDEYSNIKRLFLVW
ncbi:MAG TPA: DNA internalization-related competence protein ComEC/Rec2 [Dissulfurispiraceae bacterium]|nr:DNA internalization-related competence protein ComEC/Rec2 [Dissulfurispiraceae bacterium]